MSCQYDGEDIQIAFNAKFMIEMLSAAETDDVRLELSTPSKAGLIKPSEQAEGEDLLMLVMPLMLNN
jgi:DNA polymerase-3 subunit beta